jgi:hypothetical protein
MNKQNANCSSVRMPQETTPLVKLNCRWEDNIKVNLVVGGQLLARGNKQ